MKILMLNASFSCSGYTPGLCNALADAGCHVELYTGPYYLVASRNWERVAYRPRIRFYRLTQMRSYTIGPMRALWRLLRLLGHVWSMTRIIFDAHRFDVVHVQYLSVRSAPKRNSGQKNHWGRPGGIVSENDLIGFLRPRPILGLQTRHPRTSGSPIHTNIAVTPGQPRGHHRPKRDRQEHNRSAARWATRTECVCLARP